MRIRMRGIIETGSLNELNSQAFFFSRARPQRCVYAKRRQTLLRGALDEFRDQYIFIDNHLKDAGQAGNAKAERLHENGYVTHHVA